MHGEQTIQPGNAASTSVPWRSQDRFLVGHCVTAIGNAISGRSPDRLVDGGRRDIEGNCVATGSVFLRLR